MNGALMRRLRAAGAAAAVGVVVAVGAVHALSASGGPPSSGPVQVTPGAVRPPAAFVRADGLYGFRGRGRAPLADRISGALMGPLSPVAVPSPDRRYVAYNSWFEPRPIDSERSFTKQGIRPGDVLGTPTLRVLDTRTGSDAPLERGAYSIAWRADGAVAYVRGTDASLRAGSAYTGAVVVRRSLRGPAEQWTTQDARYVVYGWAGDRLLVYRIEPGERLELLVLDGPGRVRALGAGSIVAVSPDGARAFLVAEDQRHVRVLEVGTGRELAQLDLSQATQPLEWVAYSGAWQGDLVVAPASAGLVVFHVGAESISVEQVLAFDRDQFPAGIQEPRFGDAAGNDVFATIDLPPRADQAATTFFVDCDRIARTCTRGDAAPAREWLRLIDNPSRPTGGGA